MYSISPRRWGILLCLLALPFSVDFVVRAATDPASTNPAPAGSAATSTSAPDIPPAAYTAEIKVTGPTTQFKLLMGTTRSTRDKLSAAYIMNSLFIMDFAPGGTNIPHHHDREEEVYYVLRGRGDIVAGGGMDGNEGRHPVTEGDAYFYRLNATVGFYSGMKEGEQHALILAVRSRYPFTQQRRPARARANQ